MELRRAQSRPPAGSGWAPEWASEVNRWITGDRHLTPAAYFAHVYCRRARTHGLSVGCADLRAQRELLASGACRHMVAVDESQERIEQARADTPPELVGRLEFVCAAIEDWSASERFDLVLCTGGLSQAADLEATLTTLRNALSHDGLLCVDEFAGTGAAELTPDAIDRAKNVLDEASHGDDVDARLIADSAGDLWSNATPDARIAELLHAGFDTVEERWWGRAALAQLYNALVVDWADPDDLIAAMKRVDRSLPVGGDYLWGVYRPPRRWTRNTLREPQIDGRLDAIDASCAVGWAVDRSDPGARMSVDLLVDHKLVAKTVAELPRPDLLREGVGDGAHAFRVELPGWVLDGREHAISVLVPAFGVTIAPARGWEQRNHALPSLTSFAWAPHDPDVPPLPAKRVLAGRDGWAFECDDALGTIEQLLGRLALTRFDLHCWRSMLERHSRDLASRGIPYVVAIAPSRAAVHPERLPSSSPQVAPPKLARQLIDALSDGGPDVVDLLPALLDAARGGRSQYYKRDPELNADGAWTVARRLIEAIRQRNVAVAEPDPRAFRFTQRPFVGAFGGIPAVAIDDGGFRPVPATSAPEVARRPDEDAMGLNRTTHRPGAAGREMTTIECPAHRDRPTALIVQDGDEPSLAPFLAAAFGRSVWVPGRALEPQLVEDQQPAIVVQILDELQLVRVPYEPPSVSTESAPRSR